MVAVRPSAEMERARRILAHIVHAGDVAQKARPIATKPPAGRQGDTAAGACPLLVATAHHEPAARLADDWLGMRRPALPAEGIAAHTAHGKIPFPRRKSARTRGTADRRSDGYGPPSTTQAGPRARSEQSRLASGEVAVKLVFSTASKSSTSGTSRRISQALRAVRIP